MFTRKRGKNGKKLKLVASETLEVITTQLQHNYNITCAKTNPQPHHMLPEVKMFMSMKNKRQLSIEKQNMEKFHHFTNKE